MNRLQGPLSSLLAPLTKIVHLSIFKRFLDGHSLIEAEYLCWDIGHNSCYRVSNDFAYGFAWCSFSRMFACCYCISCRPLPVLSLQGPNDASHTSTNYCRHGLHEANYIEYSIMMSNDLFVVLFRGELHDPPLPVRRVLLCGGGWVAPRRPPQRRLSLRLLRPPPPRPPGPHQQARVMATPRREGRSPCHSCTTVPAVLRLPRLGPCPTRDYQDE